MLRASAFLIFLLSAASLGYAQGDSILVKNLHFESGLLGAEFDSKNYDDPCNSDSCLVLDVEQLIGIVVGRKCPETGETTFRIDAKIPIRSSVRSSPASYSLENGFAHVTLPEAAAATGEDPVLTILANSVPRRTYLHEYGAIRLNGSSGSCFVLDPDNDDGPAYYSSLQIQNRGRVLTANVVRQGVQTKINGWVYKATSTSRYPSDYRYIFLAQQPTDPNNVVSSYVGVSRSFNNNTIFQEYRANFTAHKNNN